jgi:hypothetical protein
MNQMNRLFRKDHLVYAETLKNASTWVKEILIQNKFSLTNLADVDWGKDHVFGFIQHPHRRRAKGIAEDLLTFYSVEQYLLNNLGHRFWVDHLTFGPHSIPLSLQWHSKAEKIDWIPIDIKHIDVASVLSKLFKHHGLEFHYDEQIEKHLSDDYKTEIFERIRHMIGNGSDTLNLMLARDEDLYNTVVSNFNPNAVDWKDATWLKINYQDNKS